MKCLLSRNLGCSSSFRFSMFNIQLPRISLHPGMELKLVSKQS